MDIQDLLAPAYGMALDLSNHNSNAISLNVCNDKQINKIFLNLFQSYASAVPSVAATIPAGVIKTGGLIKTVQDQHHELIVSPSCVTECSFVFLI